MRLLLVEDDENKREQILSYIRATFPSAEVEQATSLMSGIRQAKAKQHDIILLDMTLPNYEIRDGETGGGMHAFGGVEFLRQLRRFRITASVIVVTQFETFGQAPDLKDLPQLDYEMRQAFTSLYKGAVYYHASLEDWASKLSDLIRSVNDRSGT